MFWDHRDELSSCDHVLVKGQAVIIPKALRSKYVKLVHKSHQGADSCIRRARESLFWSGMTADIRNAVEKCETCARAAIQQQRQPLQQAETPKTAWSAVSVDMFSMRSKDYLVTVDGFRSYFEVDRLHQQTSSETILKLRIHFARYGTPALLIMDNARAFKFAEFAQFAKEWQFQHRTSSPHYPRSNGEAEAAVKVAKSLMAKCRQDDVDAYQAILD